MSKWQLAPIILILVAAGIVGMTIGTILGVFLRNATGGL